MSIEPLDREMKPDKPDFYTPSTISIGELVTFGFIDWDDDSWKWNYYNEEQYERMTKKIEGRFWTREISMLPPGDWKRRFIAKLNEIQPKYNILYKAIDDDALNVFQTYDEYEKRRSIYSDFPQTALADNQDYASSGSDNEMERVQEGDTLNKIAQFVEEYNDVDTQMLDELDVMFSCLVSFNLDGYGI